MKNQYSQLLKKSLIFTTSFLIVSIPMISLAQSTIENPLKNLGDNFPGLVAAILGYVVRIGGIIAIFAFVYSGYLFVKARGNEKELGEAKTVFFNTVIGVAILLGAQIIANIIVGTINTLR